jgi:hypothetical protein
MFDDLLHDQYEDYLASFDAWGRDFFDEPLSFEAFDELTAELEDIAIAEDCGHATSKQERRRAEIERHMLTHEDYFVDGPRVIVTTKHR